MTEETGKIKVGVPITDTSHLMDFELPPVSEKTSDFIEADPEVNPTDNGSTGSGSEQSVQNASSDQLYGNAPGASNDPAEQHRGRISDGGDVYDPAVHKYPPTQTGKRKMWSKKPRKILDQERAQNAAPDPGAEIRRAAEDTAILYGNAHQLLYGEGGQIESNDDLLGLMNALERYMQQNGTVETPPTLSVLINAGFYTARVAQREQNKETTRAILDKVKGGFNWALIKIGLRDEPTIVDKAVDGVKQAYEPLNAGG